MKIIIDIDEETYNRAKNEPPIICGMNDGLIYQSNIKEAIANGTPYETRPQGESIRIEDGLKKARHGNYVIYDVDFLLDNLAREVHIMEGVRQWKADGIIRDCGEENE